MVKDSDIPSAESCETMNGHSTNEDQKNKFDNLTNTLKSLAEASYAKSDDKPYLSENNEQVESIRSYVEEDIDEGSACLKSKSVNSVISKAEESQDKDEKNETVDSIKDQELVLIHDAGFIVKIIAPGVEPFDIQVFC